MSEHPLNTGVHFFFFDEFAPFDLVDSNLHLLAKASAAHNQLRHRFLYKRVCSASGSGRQLIELSFLTLGQLHFHAPNVGVLRFCVNSRAAEGPYPVTNRRNSRPARLSFFLRR